MWLYVPFGATSLPYFDNTLISPCLSLPVDFDLRFIGMYVGQKCVDWYLETQRGWELKG